jgi:hypothetical protein
MMYDIDSHDDDIMKEVWKMKAEVSAKFATWADYPAYSKKVHDRLVAEGWKYATPEEVVAKNHPVDTAKLA